MVAYKEIRDNGIGSHHSIVRNIASLKDYKRNFVKLGKNPDFVGRTISRKEASIDHFVNISDEVSFHFFLKSRKILLKSCQLKSKGDRRLKIDFKNTVKERNQEKRDRLFEEI